MRCRLRAMMMAAAFLSSVAMMAQHESRGRSLGVREWVLTGTVVTVQGDPINGARVRVQVPMLSSVEGLRELITNLRGEFSTEYSLAADAVQDSRVELTVTMNGFREAHRLVDSEGTTGGLSALEITLQAENEDPDLLPQADLISGLAPALKSLVSSDELSPANDYARGVEEFLDRKRPDRALPYLSRVVKRKAACVACRTMRGLAELEWSDWDGALSDFTEATEQGRKDPQRGRPEPAVALGVMESWRHQPERAAGYLAAALKYAPDHALALQEIGRAELQLRRWDAANQHLARALALGASPEARLLHVEALLGAGKAADAEREVTRYLNGREVRTMPVRVRILWTKVQNQKKAEATYGGVKTEVDASIDDLRRAAPELKGVEFDPDQKLLEPILTAVGKNVQEFFRNFPNTSSLEQIHQRKLRGHGKGATEQSQKFQYLCVAPAEAWGPGFDEYRADLSGVAAQPGGLTDGFMLTAGFASTSLIFHPTYQPESTFRYLGRQKVNGRDTHVVAFAQHPSQAHVYTLFKDGKRDTAVYVQGFAWVDSQSYQILRLHTEMMKPLPEVELRRQTTDIDFSEVHFKSISEAFWLPHEVAVTVDWRGRVLRNDHEYSDFKVFNVDSKEKIGKPRKSARRAGESHQ